MNHFDLDRLAFVELLKRIAVGTYTLRGDFLLLQSIPLESLPEVLNRQEIQVEITRVVEGEHRFPLAPIPDVDPLLIRLSKSGVVLDGAELWDLRIVMDALEAAGSFMASEVRGELSSFIQTYGIIYRYADVVRQLDSALDTGGTVRDNATPLLSRLRSKVKKQEEKLRRNAHSIAERWFREGVAQEPEPTIKDGRFVVAVRAEARGRAEGVAVDRSRTGQTFFIEPHAISEVALELRETLREEAQEVERILADLTDACADRSEDIDADLDRMAVVDSAQAAARFQGAGPLSLPAISQGEDLVLLQARHPLLSIKLGHDNVVPLTITLTEDSRTLVISGPNSGGKTVALQTVGLCTALALCGYPIPATEGSQIPFVNNIHVDIGDEQSIEADLSTFTARLKRLQSMIKSEDSRLCLIDEAGAGTDPAQGAVLAISVLENLTSAGAYTVCITHDSRIKTYASQADGMINGRMVFSDEALTPTYEFHLGEPGRSFAFEIAERAGMPQEIVARARELMDPAEENLDRVLKDAEAIRNRLQKIEREAEINSRKAIAERREYETLVNELKTHTEEKRRSAAEEADEIIRNARSRIERVVREIRESKAAPDSIKRAHSTVRELSVKIGAELEERKAKKSSELTVPLEEGDQVYLINLDRPAVVESAGVNRVRVQTGSISLDVARDEVRKLDEETPLTSRVIVRTPVKSVPESLEIIGYRASEARSRLEKYLDDVVVAGLERVRIIHGSGKGVLQRVVEEVLKDHEQVAEFDIERDTPGGSGVTWVRLKGTAA